MNSKLSPTNAPVAPPRALRAFTLIELIGVLAVIAILVAAIVPELMRQADQLAREQEGAELKRIANAYQSHVVKDHLIPTDWVTPVASILGARTADVLVNPRGQTRCLVIDPAFRVGPNTTNRPPFTQGHAGSLLPVSPRLIFASSMSDPLPAAITNAATVTTNSFQQMWDAADATMPTGWGGGGRWQDIKLQRLHLGPSFVKLMLNNVENPGGRFSADATNTNLQMPAGGAHTPSTNLAYYLRGTRLYLRGADASLQTTESLTQDQSYIYERGLWRARLFSNYGTRKLNGGDLQMAFDLFMSSTNNPNAKNGVTLSVVSNNVIAYLRAYTNWNNGAGAGSLTTVKSAQTTMANSMSDSSGLIFKP